MKTTLDRPPAANRYIVLTVALASGSCGTSAAARTDTAPHVPVAGTQSILPPSATATGSDPRPPTSSTPTRDVFDDALREQSDSTRPCYDAYVFRADSPVDPFLVKISFVVASDGAVRDASIVTASASASDAEMEQCILNTVRDWRFPKRNGGTGARITHSINFVSTSQDGTRPLNPKDAQRVVLRGAVAVQKCYETTLKSNAGLRDRTLRLTMDIRVRSNGRVEGVNVRPTLDGEMTRCFVGAASAWIFPTFEGPIVTIEQVFTLTPKLPGQDH